MSASANPASSNLELASTISIAPTTTAAPTAAQQTSDNSAITDENLRRFENTHTRNYTVAIQAWLAQDAGEDAVTVYSRGFV
ncbi:hypothetical protein BDD12DRAFT_880569 [Trichophaea hybrida]|nr:hypothetical protein BDD12DRAFT_880569 [Trichophaea hybrida]